MRSHVTRLLAGLGAALGWAALALQLVLTLDTIGAQGGTVLDGAWRFLGYFTIIANGFAATVLSLAVFRRDTERLDFAAVTTMILVGVVYALLLRETWNPQGWQKLADMALHDVLPLIVIAFWLARPHGGLRKADIAAALVLPLAYCVYAMARGAFDHWYAYAFLDVATFGVAQVTLNCAGLGAGFAAMALALAGLDRLLHYWQV
jgi:hypothetical protein